MKKLYIVSKTRLGADYSSNHELFIAKFRLKLKKVGKTTRPFMYDLSQIPYDFTVELTNRFKGLEMIECLKYYVGGSQHFTEVVTKTIPKKKKCKAKWLSEEVLQISEKEEM